MNTKTTQAIETQGTMTDETIDYIFMFIDNYVDNTYNKYCNTCYFEVDDEDEDDIGFYLQVTNCEIMEDEDDIVNEMTQAFKELVGFDIECEWEYDTGDWDYEHTLKMRVVQ